MDTPQIVSITSAVLALLAVGYIFYVGRRARGETLTWADAAKILQRAQPLTADIKTGIEMIVLGIDQLKTKGHINTNDEAFQKAFDIARERWPDVDPQTLTVFIEGVYNATLGRNRPAPAAPPPLKTEGQLLADIEARRLLGIDDPAGSGIPL